MREKPQVTGSCLHPVCCTYHVPLKFQPVFTSVEENKNMTHYPEAGEAGHQAGHDHSVQWEVGGEGGGWGAGEDDGHCVCAWDPGTGGFWWWPGVWGRQRWLPVLGRGWANQEGEAVSGGAGHHDNIIWPPGLVSMDYTHLFSSFRPKRRTESTHRTHTHPSQGHGEEFVPQHLSSQ